MPVVTTVAQRALAIRIEDEIFLPYAKNDITLDSALDSVKQACEAFVSDCHGRIANSRKVWARTVHARFYYYLAINENSSVSQIESAVQEIAKTHENDQFEVVYFMNLAAHLIKSKCIHATSEMLQRAINIIDANSWQHIWEDGRLGSDCMKLAKAISFNPARTSSINSHKKLKIKRE